MFKHMRLSTRIAILVTVELMFLGGVAWLGYYELEALGSEITEIAEGDVTTLIALTRLTEHQLEQGTELERVARFNGIAGGEAGAGDKAARRFSTLNTDIDKELAEVRSLAAKMKATAATASGREEADRVALAIEKISESHRVYGEAGDAILAALRMGDTLTAEALMAKAEKTQEQLTTDLEALGAEVAGFTQDAASRAEADEKAAAQLLLITSAIALIIGVLLALLISASVSKALRALSEEAGSTSTELLAVAQEQSAAMGQTSSAVSETTSTAGEISQTSRVAAGRAEEVSSLAVQTTEASDAAIDAVDRGTEAMMAIQQVVESIAQSILELSTKNMEIGGITDSVSGIAEQSNLLAVNASIEAAKAGEHGKGFAVVAAEVKALAEQSKEATARIRAILAEIQKSSNAAVMITEQGTKRVQEGGSLIEEIGQSVRKLAEALEESADAAKQISLTSSEQMSGIEQIAGAMESIEQALTANSAGARQIEAKAVALQRLGADLRRIVEGGNGEVARA